MTGSVGFTVWNVRRRPLWGSDGRRVPRMSGALSRLRYFLMMSCDERLGDVGGRSLAHQAHSILRGEEPLIYQTERVLGHLCHIVSVARVEAVEHTL